MDINTLTVLASFVLPLLVDLVNRIFKVQTPDVAKIIAGILAFVVALISELSVKPAVDFADLVTRFAVVFTVSQVVFKNIYKDTSLSASIRG